jgi:isovaleryl-CoA dehydrogenase
MIQEKLAYMYTKLRTSRLLSEESLRLLSEDPMDSVGAACAILHSTESAEYIARETIQIYGGYGYIKENEPERLLRDAILGQIGAGTTEIRKKLVASGIIKRFKENSIQL